MIWIIVNLIRYTAKDRAGFLERDSMLPNILEILGFIPYKSQLHYVQCTYSV